MALAGPSFLGRQATRLASIGVAPYYGRIFLSHYNKRGYIHPRATLAHDALHWGRHVFLDERVLLFQSEDGGPVSLGYQVRIMRDTLLQTGQGGSISLGDQCTVQVRCLFSAFIGDITIGAKTQIAANCSFYSYNHQVEAGRLIREQPLVSRGGITIGADCWLGNGVTVLDGVTIGKGAVLGAGSVLTHDVPDYGIACGVPARVIGRRGHGSD